MFHSCYTSLKEQDSAGGEEEWFVGCFRQHFPYSVNKYLFCHLLSIYLRMRQTQSKPSYNLTQLIIKLIMIMFQSVCRHSSLILN